MHVFHSIPKWPGVRGGICNPSYWDGGVWGWLKSSLEAAGALGAAASILESIPTPPGSVDWTWVGCGCHKVPISDQILIRMGGIKLQLLFGFAMEQAVGSLPYLARYPSRSFPHAIFCVKKGCYKHANPLGLRLNPGLWGLPITGSRIWGIQVHMV